VHETIGLFRVVGTRLKRRGKTVLTLAIGVVGILL